MPESIMCPRSSMPSKDGDWTQCSPASTILHHARAPDSVQMLMCFIYRWSGSILPCRLKSEMSGTIPQLSDGELTLYAIPYERASKYRSSQLACPRASCISCTPLTQTLSYGRNQGGLGQLPYHGACSARSRR